MKVYHSLGELTPPLRGVSLTMGNFDGVHVGHQRVILGAQERAAECGGPMVVMTFDPHPLAVLRPRDAPKMLTPLAQKLNLFDRLGADVAVVLRSEPALLTMDARRFVEEVLVAYLEPTYIVEGENFGFGAGRRGTAQTLKQLGREFGFEVTIVPTIQLAVEEVTSKPVRVNSSLVRELLRRGHVRRAARCLGRPYRLFGGVIPGHGRGRELGYPTVNLKVGEQLIPAEGVYAGWACVGTGTYRAAISIGTSPTFEGTELAVEGHLLDFDDQVYGREVALDFIERIREQRRFGSPQQLGAQITRDIEQIRTILNAAGLG